jgi:hypothetical protein
LWNEIYELIQIIWNTEDFPEDSRTATICPMQKKGSRLICSNYRGMSLLNVTYKILLASSSSILNPLLRTY